MFQTKRCLNEGCEASFPLFRQKEHSVNCKHIKMLCQFCYNYIRKENEESHAGICMEKPVVCEGCQFELKRGFYEEHKIECKLFEFKCQFCQIKLGKEDFEKHSKQDCLLRTLKSDKLRARNEIQRLKLQILSLISRLDFSMSYNFFRNCLGCQKFCCHGNMKVCGECLESFCTGCTLVSSPNGFGDICKECEGKHLNSGLEKK